MFTILAVMVTEQGKYTGRTINNYDVKQRLGIGAMGEAYRADFRIHRNTPVVVKFLHKLEDGSKQKFQQEAEILARLSHPNIVRFYRYDIHQEGSETIPYIVMEYAEEGSVDGMIRRRGFLPVDESTDILLQTLDGLQYAHEQKVLHRDLKPSNLLLHTEPVSKHLVVWGSDFSISITAHGIDTVQLTTQQVEGTPQYMPWEQFDGKARIPSDIYSLGVIAYQLLTGSLPFVVNHSKVSNDFAFMKSYYDLHKTATVPSLEQTIRRKGREMTYPVGEYEVVVVKALQKDPAARYQSAGDFAEAIKVTQSRVQAEQAKNMWRIDMGAVQTREPLILRQDTKTFPEHAHFEGTVSSVDQINIDAYLRRGFNYYDRRKIKEAIAAYDQAIMLNPNNSDAYYSKGMALGSLGKFEEAIEFLDRSIQLNPNYSNAHRNKGFLLNGLGKYHAALKSFDRSIQLNPNDSKAYLYRADILYFLKRYKEAIEASDKAIMLDPNDKDAYIVKGHALCERSRYKEAIKAYDHAISLDPDNGEIYSYKGNAFYELGDKGFGFLKFERYEKAVEAYGLAIKLNPIDTSICNDIGNKLYSIWMISEASGSIDWRLKYRKFGSYQHWILENALLSYNLALSLDPNDKDAYAGKEKVQRLLETTFL